MDKLLQGLDRLSQQAMLVRLGALLGIFLILVFGGYQILIKPQGNALVRSEDEKTQMLQQFQAAVIRQNRIQTLHEQIKVLQERLQQQTAAMPHKVELTDLLEDITKIGEKNGLRFEMLKPLKKASASQADEARTFFETQPVSIVTVGNYHQLAQFISELAHKNQAISFGDFTIVQLPGQAQDLELTLVGNVYRYRSVDNSAVTNISDKK